MSVGVPSPDSRQACSPRASDRRFSRCWTRVLSRRERSWAARHRQLAGVVWWYGHGWIGWVGLRGPLGRCSGAGDLVPGGESAGHFASVFLGAESVAARPEVWGYPAEGGQNRWACPGEVNRFMARSR